MDNKRNADSRIPLYMQLKQAIKDEIQNGAWPLNTAIPTEQELSGRFSVSRATVRQAVSELVNEGLLVRQQGRGTFVSKPKIETSLRNFYSFTEDMIAQGRQPGSIVLEFEIVMPKPAVAEKLELTSNELVIKFIRLRLVDGDVIMLETTYLPHSLFPNLTQEDVTLHSLYSLMEERYGMKVQKAVESFEPVLVDPFASKLLEVSAGSPALFLERIGSLANGKKLELSQSIVRGDRCRYIVEMLR
ncbi:GntR family transcriptional regulator [Paenibacillus silvisoli]|uniref:GntR family transcriptional regulator n=1 Tax=Paenibacillus silvisoli TaxID=3110539 RepID=UPI0028050924|nr:GntR family transcriptional regulator [Paenibacillus silvisoli]